MGRKDKVHFRNKPFWAVVDGEGDTPIKCTPVVYDRIDTCGVGILFEDGNGQVWGLFSPRDLIAAWRGTEVLHRLDVIEHATLAGAYYTGLRDPNKSDMDSHVKPTIAKIGRKAYNEIMAMPVPEEIIRAILDNQGDDIAPDLDPIIDEVRAGTIEWRQGFADAGVKHPNEIDAKRRAQAETVAKFEKLLLSYAKSRNMSREGIGMGYVESSLLDLVEMGKYETYSNEVVVALAGVLGELAASELTMALLPFGISDNQYDKTYDEAIAHSAKWLASNSRGQRLLLFRRRRTESFTYDSAEALLRRLHEELFPQKPEKAPASA